VAAAELYAPHPHFAADGDWLNKWWDRRSELATGAAGRGAAPGGWRGWTAAATVALPARADDYRFCYMGPAGSWTPLHHDVLRSYSGSVALSLRTTAHPLHTRFTDIFGTSVSEATMRPNPRSYSWSANVCGVKRWLLFPPAVTPLLADRHGALSHGR
jgi:hypothetical protein